jgi:uncharacterized protein YhbP (UPF0306 family)
VRSERQLLELVNLNLLDRLRENGAKSAMPQSEVKIIRVLDPAGAPIQGTEIATGRVRRIVFRLLAENVLCSMASITAENRAHINTAYFAFSDELELYFLSHPNALHCRNVQSNSSLAIAIFPSHQIWAGRDRGLQLFGTCRQATRQQASKADQLYGKRFAEYSRWKNGLASDASGRDFRFYRFVTARMKVFEEEELGSGVFVLAGVKRASGA